MLSFNDYNLSQYPRFSQSLICDKSKDDEYTVHVKKAPDVFKRTLDPMTTTTSVIGVKYDGGVAIAADVGGYYGKMARFKHLDRIYKVNSHTVMTAGGDFADYQYIMDLIEQRSISEEVLYDGHQMNAKSLYTWLTRIMYARRSKFDPLWNVVVVAGVDPVNGGFIGVVDKLGLAYEETSIATGMGSHIALPMLRDAIQANGDKPFTKEQAEAALKKCLEVLFYRDCLSIPKARIATVTSEGVEISPIINIESNWEIAERVVGFE